ncbi:MAG: biotin--[acetyl-CoA-carboxylase] ligase [Lachnospiraceae bacterium]|nr:biotin--[acetyl-CoA-carboxylase] ligase [Lachnospiraceae bacterium]
MIKKEIVLGELLRSNDYISGSYLGRILNCTRAAISVYIGQLRNEGYVIDSVTNRGYKLISAPNALIRELLTPYLNSRRTKTVLCVDSTPSTNLLLRSMAEEGAPDGQVVIADSQTKGRGRLGRDFYSPMGKGIYLSMLLRPDCPPEKTLTLTPCAAVAAVRAIEKTTGIRPSIKWVNDLLLGGKKTAGILTEMSIEAESGSISYIICGIGINVLEDETDFSEELRNIATSIKLYSGKTCFRAALAAALIEEFDHMRKNWLSDSNGYLEAYRELCVTKNCAITIHEPSGKQRTAHAIGIGDDFSLEVVNEDGSRESLKSGEVSIRPLA